MIFEAAQGIPHTFQLFGTPVPGCIPRQGRRERVHTLSGKRSPLRQTCPPKKGAIPPDSSGPPRALGPPFVRGRPIFSVLLAGCPRAWPQWSSSEARAEGRSEVELEFDPSKEKCPYHIIGDEPTRDLAPNTVPMLKGRRCGQARTWRLSFFLSRLLDLFHAFRGLAQRRLEVPVSFRVIRKLHLGRVPFQLAFDA